MKTDYTKYTFTAAEFLLYTAEAAGICTAVNYLFYRRAAAFIPLAGFIPVYLKLIKKNCIRNRIKKLDTDFKEALNSLSVSLRAGHSVENAFIESEKYLVSTLGENNDLTKEIKYLNRQVRLNTPVETLLTDLGTRSRAENIENFAAVFSVAKRSGGNMTGIIDTTARHIDGRTEVEKEVDAAIAGKKFEQKIMSVMPFLIIFYMQVTFPELLAPLYSGITGIIIMTSCLAVYCAAFAMGRKIVNIEV